MFKLLRPFKIHYELQDGLVLYIRGSAMRLKAAADERHVRNICYLLEILNRGKVLSVNLATYIAKSLHADDIGYLVGILFRRHIPMRAE